MNHYLYRTSDVKETIFRSTTLYGNGIIRIGKCVTTLGPDASHVLTQPPDTEEAVLDTVPTVIQLKYNLELSAFVHLGTVCAQARRTDSDTNCYNIMYKCKTPLNRPPWKYTFIVRAFVVLPVERQVLDPKQS